LNQDRLQTIFTWQEKFNRMVRDERQLDWDQSTWIQKMGLALMVELGEVMEEARYKWWKNPKPLDAEKLHEELVDVFHFFVSMCLDAGLDAEGLYQGYLAKNRENFARQAGLSDRDGYAPHEISE
jgi:dimeric dUTPase (all-alpha-NTP-PPase superfamily)